MFVEWIVRGKPSLLGALSGCVAGLVAVTPASGFAGPMGAIVLGLVVGAVCLFFVSVVKNAFGYDDALDVFGVHCIGGIVGALGTGILVSPMLGGTGIMDYATGKIADYDMWTQLTAQSKAVGTTLVWSGFGSLVLYKVVGSGRIAGLAGIRAGRSRSHRPRRARLRSVAGESRRGAQEYGGGKYPALSPPSWRGPGASQGLFLWRATGLTAMVNRALTQIACNPLIILERATDCYTPFTVRFWRGAPIASAPPDGAPPGLRDRRRRP
jgi:hypothetical protein